jgi:hypothetical protein
VLRRQLMIVERHVPRSRYNDNDRLLLSVLANVLRRERWCVFLVTPANPAALASGAGPSTLDTASPGSAPGLSDETVELVLRVARENPDGNTGGSTANWSDSDTRSPPPPCGRCCARRGSTRRHG